MSPTLADGVSIVVFWGTFLLYALASGWWLLEITVLARGWRADDETAVGLSDIQVRILTHDSPATVQVTANSVPDGIAETVVVAEREMAIDGASVHVVPTDFECQAQRKGRALEWARRTVPCDQPYVLYLDEDSIMVDFDGLPAADLIQITEHPLRTDSWLVYLCEVFRVGYQREQRAFHRFAYPLYAWGGAVAVRRDLEDAVTWDVPTITEDTTFIWRAARYLDSRGERLEYRLLNSRFRNQAPPSVRGMITQRRRWLSGTLRDIGRLPPRYLPLAWSRIVTWTLSPVVPLIALVAFLVPDLVPGADLYRLGSVGLFGMLFVYMTTGLVEYRKYPESWPVYLAMTPLVVALHAVGALWGLVRPAADFSITAKTPGRASLATLRELNPDLDAEAASQGGESEAESAATE